MKLTNHNGKKKRKRKWLYAIEKTKFSLLIKRSHMGTFYCANDPTKNYERNFSDTRFVISHLQDMVIRFISSKEIENTVMFKLAMVVAEVYFFTWFNPYLLGFCFTFGAMGSYWSVVEQYVRYPHVVGLCHYL